LYAETRGGRQEVKKTALEKEKKPDYSWPSEQANGLGSCLLAIMLSGKGSIEMATSASIDRNLTVIRLGIPHDANVILILWHNDEFKDACQGPCHLVCRWFNKQRECIEPGWTVTIEAA
jgi:hypothetical protein